LQVATLSLSLVGWLWQWISEKGTEEADRPMAMRRGVKMEVIRGHQASHDFWQRQNCSPPRAPITHARPRNCGSRQGPHVQAMHLDLVTPPQCSCVYFHSGQFLDVIHTVCMICVLQTKYTNDFYLGHLKPPHDDDDDDDGELVIIKMSHGRSILYEMV